VEQCDAAVAAHGIPLPAAEELDERPQWYALFIHFDFDSCSNPCRLVQIIITAAFALQSTEHFPTSLPIHDESCEIVFAFPDIAVTKCILKILIFMLHN
jgi:hypothetical protein